MDYLKQFPGYCGIKQENNLFKSTNRRLICTDMYRGKYPAAFAAIPE
jgi:hypothetical protein